MPDDQPGLPVFRRRTLGSGWPAKMKPVSQNERPGRPQGPGAPRQRQPLPGAVVVVVLFVVLTGLAVVAFRILRPPPTGAAITTGTAGAKMVSAEVFERYHALDARQREWDHTVWLDEMLAEQHEEMFVQLWDKLNRAPDPLAVLLEVGVAEVRLGVTNREQNLGHGVQSVQFGEPAQRLNQATWRERLQAWRQDGWRLENSEWRMRQFTPPTNSQPATSVIGLVGDALNTGRNLRAIVRGDLLVSWRPAGVEGSLPQPLLIDATHLELLTRPGETGFRERQSIPVSPEPKSSYVDPLIVYDLDGDGVDEIILACKNLVLRNQNGTFVAQSLCDQPPKLIHTGVLADFTGDGIADFLAADREGLLLFVGQSGGRFPDPGRRVWRSPEPLKFVEVLTAGDCNGDGSLDVWLAQYKVPHVRGQMPTPYYNANDGYPSFLLMNDGAGNFRDATESAGLAAKRFRRSYSASFVDFDGDGRQDLLVISDFAGVDLYRNDGGGHFTDVTATQVDEPHLFGMAHALADFDGDGRLDFLAIGMNSPAAERLDHLGLGPRERPDYQAMRRIMTAGNRLYLGRAGGFHGAPGNAQIAHTGWSWGVTAFDFDNSGSLALYIAAGHESKGSVRDYEARFWQHDIYAGSSADDAAAEMFFGAENLARGQGSYGGYYQNQFFLHHANAGFQEVGYLLGLAPRADSRNVASADLNGDGRLDLAFITVDPTFQHQVLHLLENRLPETGNWIGFRLREEGGGYSPVGARVTITTASGRQTRWLVLGDSFRSQHAPVAHFGLGKETAVQSAEIRWPNGQTRLLTQPAVNRYHAVKAR